jgi:hypothetical protein
MPGCVFRVGGLDFDLDGFLATSPFKPHATWRRGEARFRRRGPEENSGFNLMVSEANGSEFSTQVGDAIAFLEAHESEVQRLRDYPGVDSLTLDFGIDRRDDLIQCEYLPPSLLRLAGCLGLGLELSFYPSSISTKGV